MDKSKLYILSRGNVFECAVQEPIVWETHRKGTPGKLTFNVMNVEPLAFYEGDAVRFEYNGQKVFYGFVFTKKRSNSRIISVTAYDQLRSFKNKDTYTYKAKTAAQLLKMLITDFKLKAGSIDDTKHVISSRVEDNQELFSMMENSLAITTKHTGKLFILYDDCGSINLREAKDMKVNILVDEESAETYEYTSSIDENTYNKIKLYREDKKKGKREIFIAQDSSKMNEWGVLQFTDSVENGENGKLKADTLLALYNRKSRQLHINKVFGDSRVRGGSIVGVQMHLGDLKVANFMMVETAKHSFYESKHQMDMKVIGGDFSA